MGRGFREGNGLRLTNKNWEHRSMVGDDWEILGKPFLNSVEEKVLKGYL
jgi:hypothetical protein